MWQIIWNLQRLLLGSCKFYFCTCFFIVAFWSLCCLIFQISRTCVIYAECLFFFVKCDVLECWVAIDVLVQIVRLILVDLYFTHCLQRKLSLVCFILSYISICIPSWRPYLKVACENNMCFICAFLNMYFELTFRMRRPGVYWILIKYAFIWVYIFNICAHVLQYFLIKETMSILIFFTYVFILVYIIVIRRNFTYNRKYLGEKVTAVCSI